MRSDHPPGGELEAHARGDLAGAAAARVRHHLAGCAACRDRTATFRPRSNSGMTAAVAGAIRAAATADPSAPPVPAELLTLSQYAEVRELGRGGMGVVYVARNTDMGRLEALKVMQSSALERAGSGSVERFLREIQAAARLSHPNVVAAYSVHRPGGLIVFAMEYAPGRDLAQLVKAKGALPVGVACSYAHAVAMGLQHAHEAGMVHRDIKPGNLILTKVNGKAAVKVLDFGLAKVSGPSSGGEGGAADLTGDGAMMGTPAFMAPEQATDAARADIRADIYSLGCTLYYLLAGRAPFGGANAYAVVAQHQRGGATPLDELQPGVPRGLAEAVAAMMARDPAGRPSTPAEAARAIRPFVAAPSPPGSARAAPLAPKSGPAALVETSRPERTDSRKPAPPADLITRPGYRAGAMPNQTHHLNPEDFLPKATAAAPVIRKRRRAEPASPRRPAWLMPLVAAGLVALGLGGAYFAGAFKLKTANGTVIVDGAPDGADITVEGATVTVTRSGEGVTVGEVPADGKGHRLRVTKGGVELFATDVTVTVGGAPVRLRYEPKEPKPAPAAAATPAPAAVAPAGWVPLFDGATTAGWRADALHRGTFAARGGVLALAGGPVPAKGDAEAEFPCALIATERADLRDVRLRITYKRSKPDALCYLALGAGDGATNLQQRFAHFSGCLVSLGGDTDLGRPRPPGSLLIHDKSGKATFAPAPGANLGGTTTLELELVGDTVRTFAADGTPLLEGYVGSLAAGRVGLWATAGAELEVSKLEVRPLAPRPAAPEVPPVFGPSAPELPARLRVHLDEFGKDDPKTAERGHGERGGHYVILGAKADHTGWNVADVLHDDFAVEAVGRVRSGGGCGFWGIHLSNWVDDRTTYSVFARIGEAGQFAILPGWFAKPPMTGPPHFALARHPAVSRGECYNRLLLVCQGNELRAYVNGALVAGPLPRSPELVRPVVQFSAEEMDLAELDRVSVYRLPAAAPKPPAPKAAATPNFGDAVARRGGTVLAGAGTWEVAGTTLRQTGLGDGWDGYPTLVFGDESLSKYTLSCRARSNTPDPNVGLLFHYQDPDNLYSYDLGGRGNTTHELAGVTGGEFARRPGNSFTRGSLTPHAWHELKLEVDGAACKCYLDGKLLFADSHLPRTRGRVGFRNWGSSSEFADIELSAPGGKVLWEGPPRLPGGAPKGDGFVPLFNGRDLAGWRGLIAQHWSFEGGQLTGKADSGDFNTFLVSDKKYRDFELRFRARLKNGLGNSGVQFRSREEAGKPFAVRGPQLDLYAGSWGSIYEEGVGATIQPSRAAARDAVRPAEFNDYTLRVVGKRVTVTVNGVVAVDEPFGKLDAEGVIAFQLQGIAPGEVAFRDVEIRELP